MKFEDTIPEAIGTRMYPVIYIYANRMDGGMAVVWRSGSNFEYSELIAAHEKYAAEVEQDAHAFRNWYVMAL